MHERRRVPSAGGGANDTLTMAPLRVPWRSGRVRVRCLEHSAASGRLRDSGSIGIANLPFLFFGSKVINILLEKKHIFCVGHRFLLGVKLTEYSYFIERMANIVFKEYYPKMGPRRVWPMTREKESNLAFKAVFMLWYSSGFSMKTTY
jgi:hypothetical protein